MPSTPHSHAQQVTASGGRYKSLCIFLSPNHHRTEQETPTIALVSTTTCRPLQNGLLLPMTTGTAVRTQRRNARRGSPDPFSAGHATGRTRAETDGEFWPHACADGNHAPWSMANSRKSTNDALADTTLSSRANASLAHDSMANNNWQLKWPRKGMDGGQLLCCSG